MYLRSFFLVLLTALFLTAASSSSAEAAGPSGSVCRASFAAEQSYTLSFLKPLPEKKNLRVGVYFGTFDPVHEGHVAVARMGAKAQNLDLVIFVPNRSTPHKRTASELKPRLEMLAARLAREENMTALVDDGGMVSKNGRAAFFDAVRKQLGASEVYQLIGQDSFQSQKAGGKINPDITWKVLAFQRGDKPLRVPPRLAGVVDVADDVSSGLSSSLVRATIKSGQVPDEDTLSPEVYAYIVEHSMYGVGGK